MRVLDVGMDEVNVRIERVDVWSDCDEVRVLDEGMDEVNVRIERVDVWSDCDEVRVLDEGMDEVNVSRVKLGIDRPQNVKY